MKGYNYNKQGYSSVCMWRI